MSDLIENLKTYYEKASDAKSQNAAMIYEDKFRELCWTAAPEILSALETVRGIEEIMQKDTHLSIYRGSFKYYVQVRNSDRGVDFMRRVPVEEGPSAAVEAARKQ